MHLLDNVVPEDRASEIARHRRTGILVDNTFYQIKDVA